MAQTPRELVAALSRIASPALDRRGRYAAAAWLLAHGHGDLLPALGLEAEARRLHAARLAAAMARPSRDRPAA